MPTNHYFSQGRLSEQRLYEDLIIEALKIYGQDVYYLPRELVNRDVIFGDDPVSRFENAYKIEMYIENIEGFDGDGDIFTKFGVEIRDACTLIVSRRRWNNLISIYETTETRPFYRPREGDLIFLSLSKSIFEITKVEDQTPFYQLKNLPVFRMRCELFEYNDEDFDTGVDVIDNIEKYHGEKTILTFDQSAITNEFELNELVEQVNNTFTIRGEISSIDASDSDAYKLIITHSNSLDGVYRTFTTTKNVIGLSSTAYGIPFDVGSPQIEEEAQNEHFDSEASDILDFRESNPFGDPV